MAQTTYYVDAHTGITDLEEVWIGDSNAFNGNTTDFAYIQASGDYITNALRGVGTTAPDTGTDTITLVEVRGYVSDNGTGTGWSGYTTLSEPTGGWTWEKVNGLTLHLYLDQGAGWDLVGQLRSGGDNLGTANFYDNTTGAYQYVYKVEIRVTHETPPEPETPILTGRSGAFLAFF